MNNTLKKLLSMALCLALAVALLPAVAVPSKAAGVAPTAVIPLLEEAFDSKGSWTLAGLTTRITFTDGILSTPVTSTQSTYLEYTLSGLGIQSTSAAPAVLCMEYSVSAPSNSYWAKLATATGAPTLTADTSRSDPSATGLGKTSSGEFETHYLYYTVAAGNLDAVTFRIGGYKGSGTDTVKFDYVKLYLVTDPATALATENGCATLTENVTVNGPLTLAKNAVLDLNGNTLTAIAVNGSEGAQIIDSSEDKSGKLDAIDLQLDNKNNPQLPLWTGSGYVFTEPKLNEENVKRAIMSNVSANGFTLDFRPGFGEAGGKNVRENYLAGGKSGITMSANLSWTDKDGVDGSLDAPLNATDIFKGMYESETHRGRLTLTGARNYPRIALTLTLSSCGVEIAFEPIVFENEAYMAATLENAYGGADSIITMTFDDAGLGTPYYDTAVFLNEQFEKYDLYGSIMAVTSYKGYFSNSTYRNNWLGVLAEGRLDMQSHSATHMALPSDSYITTYPDTAANDTPANYQTEIVDSKEYLETWVPNKVMAYAAAYNTMSDGGWAVIREHYYAARLGVRGVQSLDPTAGTEEGGWYNLKIRRLNDRANGATADIDDIDSMKGFVDEAIEQKGWLITLCHAVSDTGYCAEAAAEALFQYLAENAQDNKIWCASFNDAIRYIRERQNSKVFAIYENGKVTLRVETASATADGKALPADVFNHPLTAKVQVPETWASVVYSIDGQQKTASVFVEDNVTWAYVDILPNTSATIAAG